jgi:glycosyltransferase involved in cell wall biosynthesis
MLTIVRGREKAELLAGAKVFLFPTKLDEAFRLGMVKTLMSGTPVICSDKGACPKIISSDVGFVCKDKNDYVAPVNRITDISPHTCREGNQRVSLCENGGRLRYRVPERERA